VAVPAVSGKGRYSFLDGVSLLLSGLELLLQSLNLGRVPACDAGDPGSIPGGGNLNVCLQLGSRVIINIMHLFLHPSTPPQVHNVESHNLLEI
jgi:hypothetical protein